MFQTFETTSRPQDGPPRLASLRAQISQAGLNGFLVPRADPHQGEYVADHDARLAWLTGFTGSAGFAAVLQDIAGVFVDGRYRLQVHDQVADVYTPVDWPDVQLADWLVQHLPEGGRIGYDPWLHTTAQIKELTSSLATSNITLHPVDNLVDGIWTDQPPRPKNPMRVHPENRAGEPHSQKRNRLGVALEKAGKRCAIISLPDSICWLLNIRGTDIPRNPIVQGFAILDTTGEVHLFTDATAEPEVRDHLGEHVHIHPRDALPDHLKDAERRTYQVDPKSTPQAILHVLQDNQSVTIVEGDDPCILPKACKNNTEIEGARAAHIRDGAAMVRFLAWLDATTPAGHLTEIDVVTQLEGFRRETNQLCDISFETICGAGEHGAIVHYRVTQDSNRKVQPDQLLLVDSGGQYLDGTTDITRTVIVGTPTAEHRDRYTRVLQGMIAVSRTQFPRGVAGNHLDALARAPLWAEGMDYDHGTGHGVGAYLSVHEGPQGLSRRATTPFQEGMIVSNEPGYYKAGAYGIRIENLIVVTKTPTGPDARDMLAFETLTYVPLDKRLIDAELLSPAERQWIDAYHAKTLDLIGPQVDGDALTWLQSACAPL